MPRKRYAPDQNIHHLREAEILLSQAMATEKAARQLGDSLQMDGRSGY